MYIGYKAGGNPGATITGENNLVVGPYSGFNLTGGSRNLISWRWQFIKSYWSSINNW